MKNLFRIYKFSLQEKQIRLNMYLIVDNELWILVENRILPSGQWFKVLQYFAGMYIGRCTVHDPVGFFQHLLHVYGITMVEEILAGKQISI